MSERYSKLFALPENLYATGSPVVIAAGALLKDNQTGKVLAQLKLRNIGKKTIKAATVFVEPLDTVGKPLGAPVTYQYLDLHADRDADFGQKTPIALPDSATRSFAVSVVQVIFTDNSIWNDDSPAWRPLNRPKPLDTLGDSELAKQFRIEYGGGCENLLLEQKDLWHCVCGAVNHQEESNCHKCGKALAELQAVDMEDLRKKKDERIAKERAEAEARRIQTEKEAEIARAKAKKVRRILGIVAALAVIAVLIVNLFQQVIIPNNRYNEALALMEAEQYEEAIAAFEALDGYKDSVQGIEKCKLASLEDKYNTAIELMNAGKYQDAIASFETMGDYKDSKYLMKYSEAEEVLSKGEVSRAAVLFAAVDYKDSKARSTELWKEISTGQTIDCGSRHTVGLKSDGTVVAVGRNDDGRCDVSGWTNIIAISAGGAHTVGLKSDGTVVAVGCNDDGQCDVSGWTNIIAISAGGAHTVGLRSDGTVVAVGNNECDQCNVSSWEGIAAISTSGTYTLGVKSGGTVVAVGYNNDGRCDVFNWSEIVAVSAGLFHAVGLKSDGTVVAVGSNESNRCGVSNWKEIVAVSAGWSHTIGLRADGTVAAVGYNDDGRCDVSNWSKIVAISGGGYHTVGLKSDGTVVAVGFNKDGQCNVSGWTDIKRP